jgi:C-terminal binding protein
MTVTVLYPEDRQIPDLAMEQEIFGPDARLIRAAKPSFAELDPADCAAADGLMIMRWAVTAADLDRFPQLRCVVPMGVGYDKLDRKALTERNILVCNVPDYGTTEVADHAVALALTLRRGILLHHELQRRDPPAPWRSFQHPMIRRLGVQNFGIIGLGRIGTAVALRAKRSTSALYSTIPTCRTVSSCRSASTAPRASRSCCARRTPCRSIHR